MSKEALIDSHPQRLRPPMHHPPPPVLVGLLIGGGREFWARPHLVLPFSTGKTPLAVAQAPRRHRRHPSLRSLSPRSSSPGPTWRSAWRSTRWSTGWSTRRSTSGKSNWEAITRRSTRQGTRNDAGRNWCRGRRARSSLLFVRVDHPYRDLPVGRPSSMRPPWWSSATRTDGRLRVGHGAQHRVIPSQSKPWLPDHRRLHGVRPLLCEEEI